MSRIDDVIAELSPDGVNFKMLGDVAELVRGNGMPKIDLTDEGVGAIHYGQIYTRYGVWATRTFSFVAPETAMKLAKVNPGDIIITNTSENVEDVGKAVAWLGEEQIVTGGHATVIRHHEDSKYLSYWFQSESFFVQKKALATGTKVINVSARQLAKIRIPVPPLEVQREIGRILDSFTELEAELQARKIQDVHFRNSLLAFPDSSGLRWVTIAEVATNLDSKRKPVTKSARESGTYPYYGASGVVDHVGDYIFDGDYLLVSEDGANLLARSTPIAFSVTGKMWVNNHAHVLAFSSYASRRFVEIYLNSLDLRPFVTSGAQPKLNQANLNRVRIPWPDQHEQERIVSILDKFTELEAELKAELKARRRQYAHFLERLLATPRGVVEEVSLRQLEDTGIVTLGRGTVISKIDLAADPGDYPVYSSSGVGSGEFGRYGKYMFEDERITWSVDGGGRFFYRSPHKYSVTNVCGWMTVDNSRVRTRFLYYALTAEWAEQTFDYTRKAHPSVIRDVYDLRIPELNEQDRIISILDNFDALVNDLSIGLPAELAARRMQYEHYRDRLLTFEDATA